MILQEVPTFKVEIDGEEIYVCDVCELPDDLDNPLPHKHLMPFDPPVCGTCHEYMRNLSTIDGKRRYQCITWSCTNHKMYDEKGNHLGQNS